ncbi:MAG: type II toxin-antitoxin system VapC family toxin [Flavobacteriales bacterium]
MIRVFLDANILVTVLCNEYPRFGPCARVLSLCDDPRFEVYTSPLCMAIGAYFTEKKNGRKLARKKISILAEKLLVTNLGQSALHRTLADPRILDIEDGLQYHSAVDAKCGFIVTYDRKDFHFADIPVMDAEAFLLDVIVPLKRRTRT